MFKRVFLIALLVIISAPHTYANSVEPQRTIILLDTSGSMRGLQLEKAKQLILNTLEKRKTDSEFEVYTFAEQISPISSQNKSLAQLRAEVSLISAGSRTSLYDTIALLTPLATSLNADIVVLSDGEDSQSETSLSTLKQKLSTTNVRVSFLSEFIDPRFLQPVQEIVRITKGTLLQSIPLRPLPKLSAPAPNQSSSNASPFGLAFGVFLLVLIVSRKLSELLRSRKKRAENQLFLMQAANEQNFQSSADSPASVQLRNISNILDINRYFNSRPQKYLFFTMTVFFAFLVYRLFHSWLPTLLFTLATTAILMRVKLKTDENKRIRAFESELPGALKMLAGSLSAGLSFLQALSSYSEDGKEQSAREFRRALAEIQLGVPVERALESVASRMQSEDLRWAVSAFAIQREVGGSLATILNSAAETIESRFELRREVRTLSAEGRISSYILMALPIGIFLFLTLVRPEYVSFFITETIGNVLIGVIFLGLIAAWFWLQSLVRISI